MGSPRLHVSISTPAYEFEARKWKIDKYWDLCASHIRAIYVIRLRRERLANEWFSFLIPRAFHRHQDRLLFVRLLIFFFVHSNRETGQRPIFAFAPRIAARAQIMANCFDWRFEDFREFALNSNCLVPYMQYSVLVSYSQRRMIDWSDLTRSRYLGLISKKSLETSKHFISSLFPLRDSAMLCLQIRHSRSRSGKKGHFFVSCNFEKVEGAKNGRLPSINLMFYIPIREARTK